MAGEIGLIIICMAVSGMVLSALLLVPSILHLRAVNRILSHGSALDFMPKRPLIWLELVPLLGIFWRMRSVSFLDSWLRVRGEGDEPTSRLLKEHRLQWSCTCRVAALLALVVSTRLALSDTSIPEGSILAQLEYGMPIMFIVILGIDLWVSGSYTRALSRLYRGRPSEEAPLVVVNPDGNCSCRAIMSASPNEVKEACSAWARDIRWRETKGAGSALVFKLYHGLNPFALDAFFPDVRVSISEKPGETEVVFTVEPTVGFVYTTLARKRICERFTIGVCSDLVSCGKTVQPAELGIPKQNRIRLAAISKWRARIQFFLAMVALLLIVYAGVDALAGGMQWAVVGTTAFLAVCLVLLGDTIRERLVGSPGIYQLVLAPVCIALGIVLLVLLVTGLIDY